MKKIILTILIIILFPLSGISKENINIAFTIDNNYPILTLLAINSILVNNKSNSDYTFWIIENNVTDKNKKKMTKYVEDRNQKIKFINIDTDTIDDGDYLFGFSNRITPIAMARIMLPELLPKNMHSVLYLDGDIVVTDDLKELYDTNLGNYSAAMALNISNQTNAGPYELKSRQYFNSGMILMNLDIWRKEKTSTKMLKFIKKNKKIFMEEPGIQNNEKFLYPDQDLISYILDGKIKKVPQRWNNQTIMTRWTDKENKNGVIHFIGSTKPWDFPIIRNDGMSIYYKYWNMSPLRVYKLYYAGINIQNRFIEICELKLYRYLNILDSKKVHKF